MTAPVSCIVTSYNNYRALRAAVDSVLRQTLPVAEIVIADDGSTDGSREVIAALAADDARIIPILRERNLGVAANRDLALRAAQQPFVTHLDGDDLFARGKIAGEWRALAGREDAVAYSLVARVWPGKWWRTRVLDPAETVGRRDAALGRLLHRAGAIPRDMLLSRKLFERAGGFTHDMPLYEDWEFKLHLARLGAEWRPSGTLGTIYVQHATGLSSADRARHAEWKNRASGRFERAARAAALPRGAPRRLGSGNVSDRTYRGIRIMMERCHAIGHRSEIRECMGCDSKKDHE